MRALTYLVIGALLAPTSIPTAAQAQPREEREAMEACSDAVRIEVRQQYPQARAVQLLTKNPLEQGRSDIAVRGRGEFDDRNGGAARFDYSCVYDYRAGRTYGLDVHNVRPASDGKKDNSAAIAGLVLGAIVVGAIAASANDKDKDRDRRGTWSPADGVRCNSREARCYKDGRYSEKWTRRIFVR